MYESPLRSKKALFKWTPKNQPRGILNPGLTSCKLAIFSQQIGEFNENTKCIKIVAARNYTKGFYIAMERHWKGIIFIRKTSINFGCQLAAWVNVGQGWTDASRPCQELRMAWIRRARRHLAPAKGWNGGYGRTSNMRRICICVYAIDIRMYSGI